VTRALAALLALAALPVLPTLSACAAPPHKKPEPLGFMPTAVTTAEPEWIPWSVRAGKPVALDPRERHLRELRQITFGDGENAEAYWSPDGHKLIWQSTRGGAGCDQIYEIDLGSGAVHRVSTGGGRTTCAYYLYPRGDRVLFSSTLAAGEGCPPKPDRSQGYVWALDPFQIYSARPDGSDRRLLIGGRGYNAETTVAPDGSRLVFTSTRDGDLELYTARLDGSDVRRITHEPGYDGGAFFSPDSSRLVWRASRPKGQELEEYRALLARGLVKPTSLEIMVGGNEGQNARAVTLNGKANFGPAFLHDSRRVIFASNVDASPSPGQAPNFDLYVVDPDAPVTMDGTPPLERITFYDGFDGFPMFSPDGEMLAFASNRFGSAPGETNVFVARWVE
jgi:Tol biopolymer transport system component